MNKKEFFLANSLLKPPVFGGDQTILWTACVQLLKNSDFNISIPSPIKLNESNHRIRIIMNKSVNFFKFF